MQALQRPARHGLLWLKGGFRLMQRKPLNMISLAATYWLLILFLPSTLVAVVVNAAPAFGSAIASVVSFGLSLAVPVLGFGMMAACRALEDGQTPTAATLLEPFRGGLANRRLRTLLALGALYFAAAMVVLWLTALVDGGILLSLMTGNMDQLKPEELLSPEFNNATHLAIALMCPVIMAWWYAPALVGWHDLPAVKALFFSFVACWRNWRAFLVYGLFSLAFALPLLLGGSLMMLALSGGQPNALVVAVLLAIATPPYFASFYLTYRDVFVTDDDPATGHHVDLEA